MINIRANKVTIKSGKNGPVNSANGMRHIAWLIRFIIKFFEFNYSNLLIYCNKYVTQNIN